MIDLVLGTNNTKKKSEITALLPANLVRLKSLNQFSNALDVAETGTTFQQNATLKATRQAIYLKHWVLAEDSGLSVDALQGRPGVRSARYAGENQDDQANNQLLLKELQGVEQSRRGAYYSCHIVLSDPNGTVQAEADARCYGQIGLALQGTGGFGYDPLFIIPEYHRSFAQLGNTVKNVISHRACALRIFIPRLVNLLHCLA